jgi:hypothetical protein
MKVDGSGVIPVGEYCKWEEESNVAVVTGSS